MSSAAQPHHGAKTASASADEQVHSVSPRLDLAWLRPVWVVPYLLITVLAVHLGLFGIFLYNWSGDATPVQEIQVSVIPLGEAVTEVATIAAPQTAPLVSPDPPVDSAPEIADQNDPDVSKPSEAAVTPDVAPLLSAERPKIEQPDALTIAVAKPDTPRTEKPDPSPAERILQVLHNKKQQVDARRAAMRAKFLAEARAHARQQAADFSQGAEAHHAGVRDGSDPNAQMSQAAYAGLVSAELNRHKVYPSEAREAGIQGRVGVVLSIASSGAIISHEITHSSGNSAIDAAVGQMVASSHPPPPPGGSFHGSVGINFSLAH